MKINDFTKALESKYGISIEDTSTRRLTENVDCSTLECKISKILKANGYKADPKYVSAAADYIEMSNEMGDPYTVEQWFKDTEMNYPEDLELEESCKKSLSESADARPNHMKIIDLIEDGLIDYKFIAEELLRWMPDDKLGELIDMYDLDYESDDLEESKGNPVDKRAEYRDYLTKGAANSNIYDDMAKHPRKGYKQGRGVVPDVVMKSVADAGHSREKLKKDFDDYKEFKNRNQVKEFAKSRKG